MIVTDEKQLRMKCENVSIEEGTIIGESLYNELIHHPTGVGLAAPQIGINKRVAIVYVDEPIVLINPKIIKTMGDIVYSEGCLSFPNKQVKTKRYTAIVVETDNMGKVFFSAKDPDNPDLNDNSLLECIAVQHEMDHLDGVLMFDRMLLPIRKEIEPKPNEPCHCGSGKKYKKCCRKI